MMTALLVAWTLAAGDIPPEAKAAPPTAPPSATEPDLPVPPPGQAYCSDTADVCIVRQSELMRAEMNARAMLATIAKQRTEADALKAELEKLRGIKGCAKLEVQPKTVPGFKKDRDL